MLDVQRYGDVAITKDARESRSDQLYQRLDDTINYHQLLNERRQINLISFFVDGFFCAVLSSLVFDIGDSGNDVRYA